MNRPLVDIINLDGDADLELIVFDIDGSVVLSFESVDGTWMEAPLLSEHFPILKDWVFFRDYNNDGVIDIFTQALNPFTYGIQVHKGVLDNGALKFELVELADDQYNLLHYYDDFLNKRQIPVSPTNFPAIEDFDGDGDLDVLTFNSGGFYAEYYENRAIEEALGFDTWTMLQASPCWGNFYETGNNNGVLLNQPCEGLPQPSANAQLKVHGSAGLAAFDRDADGDLDVILSDVTRDSLIYLNNGGSATYGDITSQETNFPAETVVADALRMPYPSFADFNADGKEDMLISPVYFSSENVEVCWLYENVSTDDSYQFEFVQQDWLVEDMIDLGKGSDPCFVDFNQDGLLDIVVGTTGYFLEAGGSDPRLFLFLNTGTTTNPQYSLEDDDLFGFSSWGNLSWGFSPAFGDLDADGDLDCLVGDFNGRLHFLENNAGENNALNFEESIFPYMGIDTTVSIGQNATPIIHDFNNDGLGDILMGNDKGQFRYFQNQGTPGNSFFEPDPALAPNVEIWGDITLQNPGVEKGYSAPALVEDQDGQLHFMTGTEYGSVLRYEAFAADAIPEALSLANENYGDTKEGQYVRMDLADIDGDAFLEMVVGNQRGGLSIFDTDFFVGGTGIGPLETEVLVLYPNPVENVLYFDSDDSMSFRVYASSGQLVRAMEQSKESISFASLPAGVYLLEAQSSSGRLSTHKIVKQ